MFFKLLVPKKHQEMKQGPSHKVQHCQRSSTIFYFTNKYEILHLVRDVVS